MITYYAAASLDNFLAGPNHELDWLPQPEPGQDFGYGDFYRTQDVVVMGRKTYDVCMGFPEWQYKDKDCYVLTRQALRPKFNEKFLAFEPGFWRELSKNKKIYLNGGGEAAKLFLDHGLIDRLEICTIPVLLGKGLPLFAQGFPQARFKLESAKAELGLVMSAYTLEK